MKTKIRYDRNGIRILDPAHEANKLPKRCRAEDHDFVPVSTFEVGYDYMACAPVLKTQFICSKCKHRETRERIDV